MGSGISVDPPVARAATRKFEPAAECAATSAAHVADLSGFQNDAKWGTESGPQDFMNAYTSQLGDVHDSLYDLHERLLLFVQAMDNAIGKFVATDDDTATRLSITASHQNVNNTVVPTWTQRAIATALGFPNLPDAIETSGK